MRGKLFLILTVIIAHGLRGQKEGQPFLAVKTHVFKDGVAIRWTPSDMNAWRRWSRKGYKLERFRVAVNGQPASAASGLLIGGDSVLPYSEEEWVSLLKEIPAAGLVKQCLHTDTSVQRKDKNRMLQRLHEDERSYILAMLSVQADFRLAVAGGIGVIDNSVKGDEVYLYKLFPVEAPEQTIKFVVDMQDIKVLPKMDTLHLSAKDNRIILEWNAEKYKDDYYAFRIERSTDSGKNFYVLNELSLIPSSSEGTALAGNTLYVDSVVRYGATVFYRIKGISYFGQIGEPSEVARIRLFLETAAYPVFLELSKMSADSATVQWQFQNDEETNIKGFIILCATDPQAEFMPLDSVLLDAGSRKVKILCNSSVMYLKLAAVTLNGHLNVSLPLMLQRPDSIAPLSPRIIDWSTDSSGLFMIRWRANAERDILGYKVMRGNFRDQEFSSITFDYLTDTFYRDTLETGMIRDSIFYKVVAYDQRYNASGYSDVIAMAMPDRIPPAPPVIYNFRVGSKEVVLQWYSSNSSDVKACHLFRQHVQTGENTHTVLPSGFNEFKDSLTEQGATYRYTLKAEDFAGHFSVSARPTEVHIPVEKLMPPVAIKDVYNDTLKNCVTLYWDYKYDEEVSHYRIMQLMQDRVPRTAGTAEAGESFHTFYYMKPYAATRYYIIAYFKDGRRSKL